MRLMNEEFAAMRHPADSIEHILNINISSD
jgi:hypothetical protein